MAYAERTTVPVEKSKAEIEQMITRFGASHYATLNEPGRHSIAFKIQVPEGPALSIRFDMPVPGVNEFKDFDHGRGGRTKRTDKAMWKAWDGEVRRRWRALALVIKSKLEAVETGITTFEEEFLAHIVTVDGRTIGTRLIPTLADHATKNLPLLEMKDDE